MDGQLILGGSASPTPIPGTDHARYALATVPEGGTCALTDTVLASGLPLALEAAAAAAEGPAPAPAGAPALDTTVARGTVPALADPARDQARRPRSMPIPRAARPARACSTTSRPSAPTARRPLRSTPWSVPRQRRGAPAGGTATPDRITTPVVGRGASRLSQLGPSARPRRGRSPRPRRARRQHHRAGGRSRRSGAGRQRHGLGGRGCAAEMTRASMTRVATVVVPGHGSTPPQRQPIVITATGTLVQARAAQRDREVYGAADLVGQAMAPHMEAAAWAGGGPALRHHALIHPVDYLDAALASRYAAITGVALPDRDGNPVPGDGLNPPEPVPQGCQAGHPFYDLDGDGSLDRWCSDDPFHGGYQKLTVAWAQEAGGARELGAFTAHPAYSVCVLGTTAPTRTDSGVWVTRRDLLLTVGHDFKPFDHERLTLTGYKTYYDGGLITPLDPVDAADPARYQLALVNTASLAATAPPPPDGADPADLVPTVSSASAQVAADLLGTGSPQAYVLTTTAAFYDRLSSQDRHAALAVGVVASGLRPARGHHRPCRLARGGGGDLARRPRRGGAHGAGQPPALRRSRHGRAHALRSRAHPDPGRAASAAAGGQRHLHVGLPAGQVHRGGRRRARRRQRLALSLEPGLARRRALAQPVGPGLRARQRRPQRLPRSRGHDPHHHPCQPVRRRGGGRHRRTQARLARAARTPSRACAGSCAVGRRPARQRRGAGGLAGWRGALWRCGLGAARAMDDPWARALPLGVERAQRRLGGIAHAGPHAEWLPDLRCRGGLRLLCLPRAELHPDNAGAADRAAHAHEELRADRPFEAPPAGATTPALAVHPPALRRCRSRLAAAVQRRARARDHPRAHRRSTRMRSHAGDLGGTVVAELGQPRRRQPAARAKPCRAGAR